MERLTVGDIRPMVGDVVICHYWSNRLCIGTYTHCTKLKNNIVQDLMYFSTEIDDLDSEAIVSYTYNSKRIIDDRDLLRMAFKVDPESAIYKAYKEKLKCKV